mgnify:CR=1 FL=1
MYVVPEALRTDAGVVALVELEALLQAGKFAEFWAAAGAPATRALLDGVTGFDELARAGIARVVARLYAKIELAVLAELVAVADAKAAAEAFGWAVEGTCAIPPPTADNSARPKKAVDEMLKYTEVAGLVQTLTR